MSVTDKELAQRQQAARTHGIHAFETRGETALTPAKGAYLAELKRKLSTDQGRAEYREDLAAAVGIIIEMGLDQLKQDAEASKNIWKSGVLDKLGLYINVQARLLDKWPKGTEKPKDITSFLKGNNE